MEEQTNVKIITLKDLWGIFLHRLWAILLVAVIVAVAVLICDILTYEPKYDSSANLYILQQDQVKSNVEYEDFNHALKVVNDCIHIIKSRSVLDTVIKKLELDMQYEELHDDIKITNPPDTRFLEVVVESNSPQQAKRIVDEICVVGTAKITDAMGFEQVHFFEQGILNQTPCNRTSVFVYVIIGLAAMMLTYSVFLSIYFFDDKIHTEEDIKKYLNLCILGDIPNADERKRKKYGNMNYPNKYYYRTTYGGNINE